MYDSNFSSPNYSPTPPPPRDYNGTIILVLGICGLTVCGCCAPFAWSMGTTAMRRMDADGIGDSSERTLANIGRILGIIGTLLMLGAAIVLLLSSGAHRR